MWARKHFSIRKIFELMVSFYFQSISTNFIDFLFSFMLLNCSIFWAVLVCYFATKTTDRITSIGDVAYGSNWFDYPAKLQEYFVLCIAHSQRPATFHGCNLIHCTLETLAKVRWKIIMNISSENWQFFIFFS